MHSNKTCQRKTGVVSVQHYSTKKKKKAPNLSGPQQQCYREVKSKIAFRNNSLQKEASSHSSSICHLYYCI